MYEEESVVRAGQIVLDRVPFRDGQRVRVSVVATPRRSIDEVRRMLAGSSDGIADQGEPMIPLDSWDVLKRPWLLCLKARRRQPSKELAADERGDTQIRSGRNLTCVHLRSSAATSAVCRFCEP